LASIIFSIIRIVNYIIPKSNRYSMFRRCNVQEILRSTMSTNHTKNSRNSTHIKFMLSTDNQVTGKSADSASVHGGK